MLSRRAPSLRHAARFFVITMASTVSVACASSGRLRVSSLESIYSPAGAFWGSTKVQDSTVFIRMDSAVVEVAGAAGAMSPARLPSLELRALLVTTERNGWRELAASEPIPLGDGMRWGETRRLGTHEFAVPRPMEVPLDSTWVVFEFQGGGSRDAQRHIRTFACSPTNLAGHSRDAKQRALELKRDYLRVCQQVP